MASSRPVSCSGLSGGLFARSSAAQTRARIRAHGVRPRSSDVKSAQGNLGAQRSGRAQTPARKLCDTRLAADEDFGRDFMLQKLDVFSHRS